MDLINIAVATIGGEKCNSVNLRDVHAFVESKQQFGNWATNRLEDFTEGVDFIIFNNFIKNSQCGRPQTDYAVTLDTAKHICMLERNEQGKSYASISSTPKKNI